MIHFQNLTIGNTVTASVALYKNQWQKFLKLSAIAHLWLLVPIYGWARYLAIAAWISQLSLQKLSNDLEFNSQEKYFSIRSLRIFFLVALLTSVVPFLLGFLIIISLVYIGMYLEQAIFLNIPSSIIFIFYLIEDDILNEMLEWGIVILLYLITILFHVRFFLTDLVFAVEKKPKILIVIKQSYLLTENSSLKIFKTIVLSLIVTLPIWFISDFLISQFFAYIMTATNDIARNLPNTNSIYYFATFALICWSLAVNLLLMPFYQSIRAITFYRLTKLDSWDLSRRLN